MQGFFRTSLINSSMLDSTYHMTLKLLQNCILGVKIYLDLSYDICNIVMGDLT